MSASLLMSKIVSFNQAKRKKVHSQNLALNTVSEEKRQYKRVASNERLFAQIVACEDRPNLVGSTISCKAMDVSAGGMRIKSYQYIPKGSQLDLWVDIRSRPGKFFLTSDVRWVTEKSDSHHGFQLGVALHEGAATDFEEWRSIHE
jgi:hypothetical protein